MFKRNQTTKSMREINVTVLKSGLDLLKTTDGSQEDREGLTDKMKHLLDEHIEQENVNEEYQYNLGLANGFITGGALAVGGYLLGLTIRSLFNK